MWLHGAPVLGKSSMLSQNDWAGVIVPAVLAHWRFIQRVDGFLLLDACAFSLVK